MCAISATTTTATIFNSGGSYCVYATALATSATTGTLTKPATATATVSKGLACNVTIEASPTSGKFVVTAIGTIHTTATAAVCAIRLNSKTRPALTTGECWERGLSATGSALVREAVISGATTATASGASTARTTSSAARPALTTAGRCN